MTDFTDEDPDHLVLLEFVKNMTFDLTKPTSSEVDALIQTLQETARVEEARARQAQLLNEEFHALRGHHSSSSIDTIVPTDAIELAKLKSDISTLQEERTRLTTELDSLRMDQERLKTSEENLSGLRDAELKRMYRRAECNSSLDRQASLSSIPVMETLSRTSALNEAFFIWKDSPHFGTINSLRLGTVPENPVEWGEINMALGLLASLVVNIARDVHRPNFKLYTIQPEGSHSHVVSLTGTRESLPLYFTGGMFSRASFNLALTAFVQCVLELAEFAHREDPTLQLPYAITKSAVGGISVLYYASEERTWSRAMKLLLIDVKWLEAWSVKRRTMMMMGSGNGE